MIVLLQRFYALVTRQRFATSADYWRRRYKQDGSSGAGSYGRLARFKADVLNDLVASKAIQSVIELGSGDGSQLGLARYPAYIGVDISPVALKICQEKYAADNSKSFMSLEAFRAARPTAELALSLDVIYHLVEDQEFDAHMRDLFASASRYVAIYSSNSDRIVSPAPHVRHRKFSDWPDRHAPDWQVAATIANPYPFSWFNRNNTSFANFHIYERKATAAR